MHVSSDSAGQGVLLNIRWQWRHIQQINEMKPYRMQCYVARLDDAEHINASLTAAYEVLRDDPDLKRSHLFGGRYENVYIPQSRIPELAPVLDSAKLMAAAYLGLSGEALSAGFWFNEMGPGHRTLPHCHDDDDELASCVYYVRVPENSGELVLRQGVLETRVTPVEGNFVFFPPDIVHEVTENQSRRMRLSVGMNFGVRR
jgi:uncharacterized cupin superfamily protein